MHSCTYFARMVALSASSCASRSATRRASPASAIECGFADSSTLTACPCTVSCEVFDVAAADMRHYLLHLAPCPDPYPCRATGAAATTVTVAGVVSACRKGLCILIKE